MKTLIITTALIGALSAAAVQAETKTVLECEIRLVPGTNYYNKVDPNCSFDLIGGGAGPDMEAIRDALYPDPAPVDPIDPEEPEEDPEEPTDPVDPPAETL